MRHHFPAASSKAPNRADLDAMLAPIRQRFFSNLEVRILRLETAAVELQSNPEAADALEIVQRDCHKLAGVAPTLGFSNIGALALDIETEVKIGRRMTPPVAEALEHLLTELERELETQG